jgi:hypothetical protein
VLTRQLFASLLLLAGLAACNKTTSPPCGEGYQNATVVRGRNGCDQNGFLLQLAGSVTLPPDSLPAGFQQAGLKVCITYITYEDPLFCGCCGGTRLRIQQIQRQ